MKKVLAIFYLLALTISLYGQEKEDAIIFQKGSYDQFKSIIKGDTLVTNSPYHYNDTFVFRDKSVFKITNNSQYEVFNYDKIITHDTFLFYSKSTIPGILLETNIIFLDTVFNLDSVFPVFRYKLKTVRVFKSDTSDVVFDAKYVATHSHHSSLWDYNPVLGFLGTLHWKEKSKPKYSVNGTSKFISKSQQIRVKLKY